MEEKKITCTGCGEAKPVNQVLEEFPVIPMMSEDGTEYYCGCAGWSGFD